MTTAQVDYTYEELMATLPVAEPLIAGGVRCHGGFDDEGGYVSPRTRNRWPAIRAWQEQHAEQFGTPLIDAPEGAFQGHYPNAAQAKYLLQEGVTEPLVVILTRIGTVEGFGSMIRYSEIPDMQRLFDEEVRGTAMTHLDKGLFEAHARDEAGFGDEGGHKQMWFAARDIAFENPVTEDQTSEMVKRMGLAGGSSSPLAYQPLFPEIDTTFEMLVARMAGLMQIEISAFHTFAWAEEVLSDLDLVAGGGDAARLVSYVRADESPHVAYLQAVLSEMRERTIVADTGKKIPGAMVVGAIWDRALSNFTGPRREMQLAQTVSELERALEGNPRKGDILEQFHALGDVRPGQPTTPADDGVPSGY